MFFLKLKNLQNRGTRLTTKKFKNSSESPLTYGGQNLWSLYPKRIEA